MIWFLEQTEKMPLAYRSSQDYAWFPCVAELFRIWYENFRVENMCASVYSNVRAAHMVMATAAAAQ